MNHGLFQTAGGVQLAGNLNWQILHIEGSTAKHIRTLASERSASHSALVMGPEGQTVSQKGKQRTARRRAIGLLINTDGAKIPGNTHSIAALFAVWSANHPTALMHHRLADEAFVVIGVANGIPVLDKLVRTESEAVETAKRFLNGNKDASVFSEDAEHFPNRINVEDWFEAVVSNTSKATLLFKVPPNYLAWMALTILVCGSIAGYHLYNQHSKAQKLKEEMLRQAAANPETIYLDALNAARERAGVRREALSTAFAQAMTLRTRVGGWIVKRVECELDRGCKATYQRETGTFKSLVDLNPELTLIPTADLRLNDAAMSWPQALDYARIEKSNELTFVSFAQGFSASQLQDWVDASLSVQVGPPVMWPQIPGLQSNARIPGSLGQGKFEIANIQLPQVDEVIRTAPKNVVWNGFQIEVGDLKQEPMSQAKAKLNGNYYVQHQ